MGNSLTTERRNPKTVDLDLMETLDVVRLINQEDHQVAQAVQAALPQIAQAVDKIAQRLAKGGRLIYVGAGTSGRLGILDAVEAPATFGVEADTIQGMLAGGNEACYAAIEPAEDDPRQGASDLDQRKVSATDAVVGIAASGRTPYTLGAVRHARQLGALTVGISCNRNSVLSKQVDVPIEVEVGPEVIAGSTRMKAGSAEKMVLNMLSTASMVRLGHVHSNLMVNVHMKNEKLLKRAIGIVTEVADVSTDRAQAALEATGDVKSAIVMLKLGCTSEQARELIQQTGNVRKALSR